MFFLATADEHGMPQCSYKGGEPGFVRVVDEHTLAFPSYDGNGTYLSLGNLLRNPQVGILFIDFTRPKRLRVNGIASIDDDDPLLADYAEAQLIVRVRAHRRPAELPAVRAPAGARRAVALRPPRRPRDADPGLEAARVGARRARGRRSRQRRRGARGLS